IAAVSPGFFASLQAPILEGGDFDDHDAQDGPPFKFRSVIVNESLARRYFGDKSPIGARLGLGNRPDTRAEMQIVGVVKTFSYRGIREDEDQAFVPFLESQIGGANYYVRTRTASTAAFASIRPAAAPLVALAALTAAALPAHRAASLNPVEALRCE